jgi:hypothetical protein
MLNRIPGLFNRRRNGSGTGDVVGPASAGSGNVATFSGVTGKLLQDGGFSYAVGTFTPAIAFATPGTSSFVYATQNGVYARIGTLVFVPRSVGHADDRDGHRNHHIWHIAFHK